MIKQDNRQEMSHDFKREFTRNSQQRDVKNLKIVIHSLYLMAYP